MPLPPRRQHYNTVTVSDNEDEEESAFIGTAQQQQQQSRQRRRTATATTAAYSSVLATDHDDVEAELTVVPLSNGSLPPQSNNANADVENPALATATDTLTVTILDFCHTRWPVTVPSTATVLELKQAGLLVHAVAVSQQRLIYQGKLLTDEMTLPAAGITSSSAIIHLFPKPRVVVVNAAGETSHHGESPTHDESNTNAAGGGGGGGGGARIPTIVMDQAEADRRGQILVLGSMDYIEAINNVKMFSFMLLIISSIELLNLSAVALGNGQALAASPGSGGDPYTDSTPYTQDDDFFPTTPTNASHAYSSSNGTTTTTPMMDPAVAIYQTWTRLSYMDVAVSVAGVYVALLGIKASNENCVATAKLYLTGTCVTAVAWLVYNYIISLKVDEAVASEMQTSNNNNNIDNANTDNAAASSEASVYNQAFQVMILPAMVWCICIFRAWQFQHLLQEAELEAVERIAAEGQSEYEEDENNNDNDDDMEHGNSVELVPRRPPPPPSALSSATLA